jgi:hypothetical protein
MVERNFGGFGGHGFDCDAWIVALSHKFKYKLARNLRTQLRTMKDSKYYYI